MRNTIKTTVFIITIGDPALPSCEKALAEQTAQDFKMEYIRNVRPFNAAVQEMIDRCDTDYFIQVDEDMILYPDAVQNMQSVMEIAPDDVGMICFMLYDEDRKTNIQGIKIYRTCHVKGLTPRDLRASEMDLLEQMQAKGIQWIAHPEVMGLHGTDYTPQTIYLRYKSMYEKDIRTWNVLTWDIRKKADEYRRTGDVLQLFALLGAVHGIVIGPRAEDVEAKNFASYNLKELEIFKKLFLEEPPYAFEYDPGRKAQKFCNNPIPLEQVQWKAQPPSVTGKNVQIMWNKALQTNGLYAKSRNENLDIYEILETDSIISGLDGSGLPELSRQNFSDPFPHLWSGLIAWENNQYNTAWEEFELAESLNAPVWRTSWYKALVIRDDHGRWGWQNYELARDLIAKVVHEQAGFESALAYQRYLNGYYSQWGQDTLVEDFFHYNPPKHKLFVDVGAYDGISLSNTYRLFENGWCGLCIEPVSDNYDKLSVTYQGTTVRCVRMAVSLTDGEVYVSKKGTGSSICDNVGIDNEPVRSSTLSNILDSHGIGNLDFISIDAEGYDFAVLQSLDLKKWIPKLIVIEYNTDQVEKQKITDYLAEYGYELWHDNMQDLFFRSGNTIAPPNFWSQKTLMPVRSAQLPSRSQNGRTLKVNSRDNLSILHTVEFYHPHLGGAELVVQQLSERLAKRGHRVTVATTRLPERNFDRLNGVDVVQFAVSGNYANGFAGPDAVRYQEFLAGLDYDVMMNYAAQQWATDLALTHVVQKATNRVNIIAPCGYSALVDHMTLRHPQYGDYFNRIIPAVIPCYDAAVYHSAVYKDYEYASDHGFANSVVIPNGVDEDEFMVAPRIDFRGKYNIATKYIGLCVANFYTGKGQERVIHCVRNMNRRDFTMVFIGKEGERLPELQRLAAGLPVAFLSGIPREDTLAAYHAADIFLFGSEIEASPLVIIEAKASKTPFVSTDCGNVREWLGGIVCEPHEMHLRANRVLDDEAFRKQLAEEGWHEWKAKLTWEAVCDRYERLYLMLRHKKTSLGNGAKCWQ